MANTLSGVVKINGVPVPARIAIVRTTDNTIAGTTTSTTTGAWSVSSLSAGRYEAVIFKSGRRAMVEGPFDLDGTAPVLTFPAEVMADNPTWYCRHNESSGTVANNEVTTGADGTYGGTPVFGAAAIYPGGLTCWDLNGASHVDIPASCLPSPATAITLEIMLKRKATITGLQALIDRDQESGIRKWQWRWESGDDTNQIKLQDGVETFLANDIGPANSAGLYAFVITGAGGAGSAKIYKNGVLIASAAFSANADYGHNSVGMRIGRRLQGDSQGNYYCAETMVYPTALSAARLLTHAKAAGVAGIPSALLHFDGTNGSTTFTDQTGKTWTAVGNAQISTAQSKFGSGSLLLDGSGDGIQCADHPDFEFGAGDFTIQFFYRPAVAASAIVCFFDRWATNGVFINATADGRVYGGIQNTTDGVKSITEATANWVVGQWVHLALVRNGSTLTLYKDGVALGSQTVTGAIEEIAEAATIGYDSSGVRHFNGNIDEFSITKGYAEYTSNFTPPTAPRAYPA